MRVIARAVETLDWTGGRKGQERADGRKMLAECVVSPSMRNTNEQGRM